MVISRNSHLFPILNAGKPFSFKNRFRYFLFFVKKLSEGQEIVHMIKSAENDNLETQTWKPFISSLCVFLFNYTFRYFFPFFIFESHDQEIESGKSFFRFWNSNSEFCTVVWLVIYQKKARCLQNSKTCIQLKFQGDGQNNGHFSLWVVKITINSGHVTHHSKAYELNIPKKSFSLWKIVVLTS